LLAANEAIDRNRRYRRGRCGRSADHNLSPGCVGLEPIGLGRPGFCVGLLLGQSAMQIRQKLRSRTIAGVIVATSGPQLDRGSDLRRLELVGLERPRSATPK
jgi:hypothetical protein